MNRDELLANLEQQEPWDILVVGGGATGLGVAVEAASRGFRTLLVERSDFAKATSSRSTKLIHGGVRYLEQGNLTLVVDALRERGRLLRNASGLVWPLPLIVPVYRWWESPYYGIGLKLYDLLAGRLRVGRSQWLSEQETLNEMPGLNPTGLRGGALFYDAQFDDSRMAIALARTAAGKGGVLLNYVGVDSFLHRNGQICGASVRDQLTGSTYEVRARAVINCTGVFSDQVRNLDGESESLIVVSQGSHVVLDREFLPGKNGLLIPKTRDGRVLFAIPWNNRIVAGTTDMLVDEPELEPKPHEDEIDFILSHLGQYLRHEPKIDDVRSVFAGLRPLVRSSKSRRTAALSRDHSLVVSGSGLVSVVGGKWTTYRKMGEDAVDRATEVAGLEFHPSVTKDLPLQGGDESEPASRATQLHPAAPYSSEDVVRAVRDEWACTVEDVLSRRTRLLLLDARASIETAPRVAGIMACELGHDQIWETEQISAYTSLAQRYLP
jgi:glycerol-3-phosphate dehydrogenase